jgi:hypothetical protein
VLFILDSPASLTLASRIRLLACRKAVQSLDNPAPLLRHHAGEFDFTLGPPFFLQATDCKANTRAVSSPGIRDVCSFRHVLRTSVLGFRRLTAQPECPLAAVWLPRPHSAFPRRLQPCCGGVGPRSRRFSARGLGQAKTFPQARLFITAWKPR